MTTDKGMACWYALHTLPKIEHRLQQYFNAAGYATFCPMQTSFVEWRGQTKKVSSPLFPGCLFVAGDASEIVALASSQKAVLLADRDGKDLSLQAGKVELPAKFIKLLES